MLSDVAECRRAEESVRNCVEKNVCIAVSEKPFFIGNVHTTEDEAPFLNQTVNVITVSYSHVYFLPFKELYIASPKIRSSGVVIFMLK